MTTDPDALDDMERYQSAYATLACRYLANSTGSDTHAHVMALTYAILDVAAAIRERTAAPPTPTKRRRTRKRRHAK